MATTIAIALDNKTRPEVQILAIDFERGMVDLRDPVDGVCRVPLLGDPGVLPTAKDLAASAEAVLGEARAADLDDGGA